MPTVVTLGVNNSEHHAHLSSALLQAASRVLPQKIKNLLTVVTISFSSEQGLEFVSLSFQLGHEEVTVEGGARHDIRKVTAEPNRLVAEAISNLQRAIRDSADKHQRLAGELSDLAHAFFAQPGSI